MRTNPWRRPARRGAWLGAALLAAGCASPSIRVDGLEKSVPADAATEYSLVLTVSNPGSDALMLERWEFGGECGDRTFDPSVWAATRTLPPGAASTIRLPLILPGAPSDATEWTVSGTLHFRRRAKLLETIHDLGVPYPTQSFAAHGRTIGAGAAASALE